MALLRRVAAGQTKPRRARTLAERASDEWQDSGADAKAAAQAIQEVAQ